MVSASDDLSDQDDWKIFRREMEAQFYFHCGTAILMKASEVSFEDLGTDCITCKLAYYTDLQFFLKKTGRNCSSPNLTVVVIGNCILFDYKISIYVCLSPSCPCCFCFLFRLRLMGLSQQQQLRHH